jgi:uncharacterized membrane protein YgcG
MGLQFSNTGFLTHTTVITGLQPDTVYTYYVRCIDDEDNFNIDDYEITFQISPAPTGSAGEGDTDGGGEGTGSGSGSSGSGSGSSAGNTSGGGGGSSGGGGGGGGGFEDTDDEFPSGDAEVTINGICLSSKPCTRDCGRCPL